MKLVLAIFLLVFSPGAALAQPVEQGEVAMAQAQMLNRVSETTERYANSLGLDWSYVSYCQSLMFLESRHPPDGSIPFGVDYNRITTREHLQQVITAREAFETNYLRLCLADARAKLNAVGQR